MSMLVISFSPVGHKSETGLNNVLIAHSFCSNKPVQAISLFP